MVVKRELWAKNEPNSENNANDKRECFQLIAFDLLKSEVKLNHGWITIVFILIFQSGLSLGQK